MVFFRAWICLLSALIGALAFPGAPSASEPARHSLLAGLERPSEDGGAEAGVNITRHALPSSVRVLTDVAYGRAARQRMDVYLPARKVTGAPVILMVHGGAWRLGDKGMRSVVDNKMARWVSRGFILISTNYRLLPEADPEEQAHDVGQALVLAQGRATAWGGDPEKFILMGHSAGAHLVALLTASPAATLKQGARPWLGAVALDSAAFDVPQLMTGRHLPLYDRAFGQDPAFWRRVSPLHQLSAAAYPLLAVCSTRRTDACPQAYGFERKAASLGAAVTVLAQDLSHREINQSLGLDSGYTQAVEVFMGSLDPAVQQTLLSRPVD
ncbi:MAG: alpha/beta hydrolase [Candidatus Macondimonas sp.]